MPHWAALGMPVMAASQSYNLATRGSDLALWQSRHVRDRLLQAHPDIAIKIITVSTTGDRSQTDGIPVASMQSPGVFSGEVEAELLAGRAHIAVHSYKDLPTKMPDGLRLAAVSERADPRDALVARGKLTLSTLPKGARVGTSSPRRAAQLLAARNDLEIVPIRGNVPTRVQKVSDGVCDAVVLAAAGLERLGLLDHASELLSVEEMLPAPAQGALAIQTVDDDELVTLCGCLQDDTADLCIRAERNLLVALGGGCSLPLGAYATVTGNGALHLRAAFGSPSGTPLLRADVSSDSGDPDEVATQAADLLREQGADTILADLQNAG